METPSFLETKKTTKMNKKTICECVLPFNVLHIQLTHSEPKKQSLYEMESNDDNFKVRSLASIKLPLKANSVSISV